MLMILSSIYKGSKRIWQNSNWYYSRLYVVLFRLISGASRNPVRSLTPAVISDYYIDLALSYCGIIGISIVTIMWIIIEEKIIRTII
jgi:hypothetical protein